jgi:hypothetical protein
MVPPYSVAGQVAQTPHSGRSFDMRGFAAGVLRRGGGMSVTRLLICGLLVASGLTLGAFTLHGAFDERQVATAGTPGGAPGPALKPWFTSTFGAKGGPVAVGADAPDPRLPKMQARQAGAKPAARAPGAAAPDGKAAKKKRRTEKRPTEPTRKTKQQPQQTASQWPWSWFGN